jgi:hypothetical protein
VSGAIQPDQALKTGQHRQAARAACAGDTLHHASNTPFVEQAVHHAEAEEALGLPLGLSLRFHRWSTLYGLPVNGDL